MSNLVCDENLPEYGENACEINKDAAISAIGFVKKGQTTITDYSDPVQWDAAILAGEAQIAKRLSADIPDGSPITQDNKRACGAATVQVGVDYTMTIIDPNVSAENDLFWGGINGKSYDIVVYYCREDEVRLITNGSVSARLPQSVGNQNETQHYNVTINWRKSNSDFGALETAPAGIFE